MKNKIAVIAAHPDDEILGCGGTIAQHVRAGDEVHVLIMAEGLTSRQLVRDRFECSNDLTALADAAKEAHRILGTTSLTLQDFPDNRMDSVDRLDVIKTVESFIADKSPSVVYTHHVGDVNIDHRRVHEAVMTACRPFPRQRVTTLLFFEVASNTEWQPAGSAPAFQPDWFVNIADTLDLKMSALNAYKSEMRSWPHARSCEALMHLARWRGATVGTDAAEAFVLGRKIV